jgi:hypothetical protein
MKRLQMGKLVGVINNDNRKKKTVTFVKIKERGRGYTAQFAKRDLPLLNQLLFKLFEIL